MKLLLALLALSLPLGVASAQEAYAGVSGAVTYAFNADTQNVDTSAFIISPGAQLGVRNLLGPFGLRLTGEYSVFPASGLLELGGDALLNLGSVIDPYAGFGVGLAAQGGATLGMARLLGGIAPRLSPNYGLFAEGSLNAYSDGAVAVFTVRARGGVNFFF